MYVVVMKAEVINYNCMYVVVMKAEVINYNCMYIVVMKAEVYQLTVKSHCFGLWRFYRFNVFLRRCHR